MTLNKKLCFVLVLALVLSLSGCGKTDLPPDESVTEYSSVSETEISPAELTDALARENCGNINEYNSVSTGEILYESFDELLELHELLQQDDKTIKEYLSDVFPCAVGEQCTCFLQTKADLFSWLKLDELRLPFSDSIPLKEILIRIGYYEDIYVRYALGDMLFSFYLSPYDPLYVEEIITGWENPDAYKLLATKDDVNIYTYEDESYDDPRVFIAFSVNGVYVVCDVSVPCENPATCDRGQPFGSEHFCGGGQVDKQAAIDGITQFEFKTLF